MRGSKQFLNSRHPRAAPATSCATMAYFMQRTPALPEISAPLSEQSLSVGGCQPCSVILPGCDARCEPQPVAELAAVAVPALELTRCES